MFMTCREERANELMYLGGCQSKMLDRVNRMKSKGRTWKSILLLAGGFAVAGYAMFGNYDFSISDKNKSHTESALRDSSQADKVEAENVVLVRKSIHKSIDFKILESKFRSPNLENILSHLEKDKHDKSLEGSYIFDLEMKIPADVPDYLQEAIKKESDFTLTKSELAQVEKYDVLINYIARLKCFGKKSGFDPNFLKSIVAVESRGIPKACSKVYHARGLTQLRYWRAKAYVDDILDKKIDLDTIAKGVTKLGYDARCINEKTLQNFKSSHLHDPALNLMLASYGFNMNIQKFGNRKDLLAAEWNAGQSRGIKNGSVANIPETIQYVGRVNKMYVGYSAGLFH